MSAQAKSLLIVLSNLVDSAYQVVVPKTFKALIVIRVTGVDQVVVRGLQESRLLEKEVNVKN